MNGQHYQTVELEQQWLEERNAKRREHMQEQARESAATRGDEPPILRGKPAPVTLAFLENENGLCSK